MSSDRAMVSVDHETLALIELSRLENISIWSHAIAGKGTDPGEFHLCDPETE
jgi:hypothetical protein